MVHSELLIDQMFTINFYKLILGFDSWLIDILTGKNYGRKRHQMLKIYFNYLESLVYKNFSKYIFLKDILYDSGMGRAL